MIRVKTPPEIKRRSSVQFQCRPANCSKGGSEFESPPPAREAGKHMGIYRVRIEELIDV
jgi:hypothetical protein